MLEFRRALYRVNMKCSKYDFHTVYHYIEVVVLVSRMFTLKVMSTVHYMHCGHYSYPSCLMAKAELTCSVVCMPFTRPVDTHP